MTVVAIDGPAGSGKSTIASALARRLGLTHVDTGAYYRAATLAVLRRGADVDDESAVLAAVTAAVIERRHGRTMLDGQDVEDEIRGAAVTASVSSVSRHQGVRAHLVALQRDEAAGGAVVEGRDAATVIVPGADLKVWLTASAPERAARRAAQRGERGPDAVAVHAEDIARRDEMDAAQMTRDPAAIVVDTTGRSVDEIVDDLAARTAGADSFRA